MIPYVSETLLRGCLFFFMLVALWACASKPPPSSRPPKTEVSYVRYTIQAGAFSRVQNAMRLTRSLENQGLSAYYYRDKSRLFKVRFGDFASRKEALVRARSLVSAGIIEAYYIVSPDGYRATKGESYNTALLRVDLVETAERFIGLPYEWGGTSPDEGFDCSGLVMAVYQLNGISLPRSSQAQYTSGRPVGQNALQKGDLVFFSSLRGSKVSHVGVYIGNDAFIHAPGEGKVIRKDALSARWFKTRFKGARTYLR
ncbi:MAG: C40 family peptidase [Thermodesulfobacteriota bacterium]